MRIDDFHASGNAPCLIAKFVHLLIESDSHRRGLSFTSPLSFLIRFCIIFIIVVDIPLHPGVVPAVFLPQILFHWSEVCASLILSVSAMRVCTSAPRTILYREALITFQQRIGISLMPVFSTSDSVLNCPRLWRHSS